MFGKAERNMVEGLVRDGKEKEGLEVGLVWFVLDVILSRFNKG